MKISQKTIGVSIVSIIAIFIVIDNKPLFIFSFLLFLASVSRVYNHFFWLPQLGFELYSISTILTGILLGPLPGLFQGIFSNFLANLFSGKIKAYVIISVIAWGLIGLVCGLFSTILIRSDLSIIGPAFVIIYELFTFPLFVSSGARISSALFHTSTHILISLVLFRTLVPILLFFMR